MDLIVAILGALAAIFVFNNLVKHTSDKRQKQLENEVAEIKKEEARLRALEAARQKETQEKIDAITKEQEKPVTSDDLIDYFNNRKGGR